MPVRIPRRVVQPAVRILEPPVSTVTSRRVRRREILVQPRRRRLLRRRAVAVQPRPLQPLERASSADTVPARRHRIDVRSPVPFALRPVAPFVVQSQVRRADVLRVEFRRAAA